MHSDSQATFVLTTSSVRAEILRTSAEQRGYEEFTESRWIETDKLPGDLARDWREPDISGGTLAFLQYTSGSTDLPKGVKVSHANLLHNQQLIREAFGHTSQDLIAGWLPLYHDMGLIGNVLQPLYLGVPCVLMSPVHFLQKPARWLSAVTRYRATTSGGPNFAYDLCVRQITDEQRATFDLSSWTLAFNGAEPVRAATLVRFQERFASCGFSRRAFYPCYGLAESTLFVTGGSRGEPLNMHVPDPSQCGQDRPAADSLIGCGTVRPGAHVRIVDPETRLACPDGRTGEIWVSGPSVACGYWEKDEETHSTFSARVADGGDEIFLRTGDLGFIEKNQLFVSGRLKDLIIIRGRNHYPHDIERTVEECYPGLRAGGGAAFSVVVVDEETLVVVQEVEPRAKALDWEAAVTAICKAVAQQHEVAVATVVLIKAGTLPKTSSGKVQRRLCRTRFIAGELTVIHASMSGVADSLTEQSNPVAVEEDRHASLTTGVADIWAKVLERPAVEPDDDFFALGGDSLRGIQVLSRLRDAFEIDAPLEALFEHPRLREFVAFVATMPRSIAASDAPQSRPTFGQTTMPLSTAQERFWFLDQLTPGSAINNIPVALRLHGDLDTDALARALNEVIRRHDTLRSTYRLEQGRPVQSIAPHVYADIPSEDLSALTAPSQEERLAQLTGEEARRPFDLSAGPLVRWRLFRMGSDDHALSLTVHHIAADGWSMNLLRQELAVLYEAFKSGRTPSLPSLPVQYGDLMAGPPYRLSDDRLRELQAYWQDRLKHVPHVLNLPYDYPRPAVQGQRGARHEWQIESSVVQRLKAAGAGRRATLFMNLLTAFGLVLSRYSGQSDFCIGTPVANRRTRESERLIGCFVNTVVLRLDLSGDPTYAQLLERTRATVLGAKAHDAVPFERLVDELGASRDLGRTPWFQTMFVLEDESTDVQKLGSLDSARMKVDTQTSMFDLTLEMAQRTDGSIAGVFEYRTDLFAEGTIGRLAGHFQELLRQIAASSDTRASILSMLAEPERQSVLEDWNRTAAPFPEQACLQELFEAQAARTPEAPALVSDGVVYDYASLNRQANRLASYLHTRGAACETPVVLCLHRSFEMAFALLGCLKAGAPYVPVDPSYPSERLAAVLADVRPQLIVTMQCYAAALSGFNVPIVALDRDWPLVEPMPAEDLSLLTSPDNLAYILYTSGTTGQPKGSGITHRSLVNHTVAMVKAYGLGPSDRVLQFASVSFDVAAEECFPTWIAGGTVCLRPNEPVPAFSDLDGFVRVHQLTVLNLPTPYWAGWTEDMEQTGANVPPSVRLVIVGSEQALPESLLLWRRIANNRIAWCNAYGPTETTITSSIYNACELPDKPLRAVPIGRPIANVTMYVLDRHLQPVPNGIPGDLYIGGAGLSRGYHRLPALTASSFIPHPFGRHPGERLYRTGDRARRLSDGNLEFLGRSDDQIKIRGFRVELADIEFHLRTHPLVIECKVFMEAGAPADWSALLAGLSEAQQESVLSEIESIGAAEAQWLYDLESGPEERRKTMIQRQPEVDVYLKIHEADSMAAKAVK